MILFQFSTYLRNSAIRHKLKATDWRRYLDFDELEILRDARQKVSTLKLPEKLEGDELVCQCNCISVEDIKEFLAKREIDLPDLTKKLGVGSGCGACLKDFSFWKDRL